MSENIKIRLSLFDRIEAAYLRVLRILILVIATIMIIVTLWLGASSLYKISKSANSVKEAEAKVSADDLAEAARVPVKASAASEKPAASPEEIEYLNNFVIRYYSLFKSKFEVFQHGDDKVLSKDDFDGLFVRATDHIAGLGDGTINFEKDKADLEGLLIVMANVAQHPDTKNALLRYQRAHKVNVTRDVRRTRYEFRRGWDSGSTACASWYESPIGCPTRRMVEIPYTERTTVLEYPNGITAPINLFGALQHKYYDLLASRRDANARTAEAERDAITFGNAQGRASLVLAFEVLGGFVTLLFFFLLIAIERHQRRIAAAVLLVPTGGDES